MATVVTTCKMNTVLDAFVARIQQYVKPNSGLNLVQTVPQVKRILRLGDFTGATKPLVAVQCGEWTADPKPARRFDGNLTIIAYCMVDTRDGDEQQLLNLVTDVIRAIQRDETLGGLVTYTFVTAFTPNVDTSASTGYAQAAVTFNLKYNWDADTP